MHVVNSWWKTFRNPLYIWYAVFKIQVDKGTFYHVSPPLEDHQADPLRGLIILWRGGACPGSEVNSDTLCSLRLLPDSANSFITVSALSRDTQAVAHRSRFPRHAVSDCCSAGFMSRAGSWYKLFFTVTDVFCQHLKLLTQGIGGAVQHL